MKLYKRDIMDAVEPFIGDETIIVLYGARQVGKTHVLFSIREELTKRGKKVLYYDLEYPELLLDLNQGVDVFIADLKGKGYVEGEDVFVLIDEIQYLDNPSSFLKIVADHHKNIHLIVSGSSTFNIKSKFTDSLAGRYVAFEMFPLSFEEFLRFKERPYRTAEVTTPSGIAALTELYREFVRFGGYPKVALEDSEEKKKAYLLQVIDTYIRKDVRDLARVEDVKKFNNLLFVLASQSGQLLDRKALSSETGISFATLHKYLAVLEETFVLQLVSPYSKSPTVEITKNPKVFFYDSGLQSLLWLRNFQNTIMGTTFETNIFGELVKRYGRNAIHFWRTKARQEVDFIVTTDMDDVLPIEVKLSLSHVDTRAIGSFLRRYRRTEWRVIGLTGEKKGNQYRYPWETWF
jgi:predicted AAA+ superfamily ATPase